VGFGVRKPTRTKARPGAGSRLFEHRYRLMHAAAHGHVEQAALLAVNALVAVITHSLARRLSPDPIFRLYESKLCMATFS
jgi:hypothetical protein